MHYHHRLTICVKPKPTSTPYKMIVHVVWKFAGFSSASEVPDQRHIVEFKILVIIILLIFNLNKNRKLLVFSKASNWIIIITSVICCYDKACGL